MRRLGGGAYPIERALDAPAVRPAVDCDGELHRTLVQLLRWVVQPRMCRVGARSAVLPDGGFGVEAERVPDTFHLEVKAKREDASRRAGTGPTAVRVSAGDGHRQEPL